MVLVADTELLSSGCALQSGVARIGEEWLYEYYGNQGSNVKVVTVYPGSMYTDFARHTMPGK